MVADAKAAAGGHIHPHVIRSFTLRNLVKNRARSIVTIIGIALSCALLTAVMLSVGSLTSYMRDSEVAYDGAWLASATTTDEDAIEAARADANVAALTDVTYVGQLASYDPEKEGPSEAVAWQLKVEAMDANLTQLCALGLSEGRLPQNSHEIVLDNAYKGTTELTDEPCELGSAVSGELALRRASDGSGDFIDPDAGMADKGEGLEGSGVDASYTVVGFFDRGSSLTWSTSTAYVYADGRIAGPGQGGTLAATIPAFMPAFTYADAGLVTAASALGQPDGHSVYLATQDIDTREGLDSLMQSLFGAEAPITFHDSLLRYMFMTSDRAIWDTVYQLAVIICAVIVVASASLIFNAFAISVAERTRQFGLLASVGASKRQIRGTVFWEALALAAIGIPLGLLVGVVGSGVVLGSISGQIASALGGIATGVEFRLVVDARSLLVGAGLGLLVVLLSAWVPSRRAASVSVVEAMRNASDVRLPRGQLRRVRACNGNPWKPSGLDLGGRILGVPAMLARRTSTRGPAKARVASASLAVAVVLFVTTGALNQALNTMAGVSTQYCDFDIAVSGYSNDSVDVSDADALYRRLCDADGVTGTGAVAMGTLPAAMPASMAGPDAYGYTDGEDKVQYQAAVTFLDDASFDAYLSKLGLSASEYTDASHPRAIAYNGGFVGGGEKYVQESVYAGPGTVDLLAYDIPGGQSQASAFYESMSADPSSDGSWELEVPEQGDNVAAGVKEGTLDVSSDASDARAASVPASASATVTDSVSGDTGTDLSNPSGSADVAADDSEAAGVSGVARNANDAVAMADAADSADASASDDSEALAGEPSIAVYPRSEYAKPFASVEVGTVAGEAPDGMSLYYQATLILPMSAADTLFAGRDISNLSVSGGLDLSFFFNADDPAQAVTDLSNVVARAGLMGYSVINVHENSQSSQDFATVINTFSYAFAAILALVAVANVFNTLVSSLILRRREFAVLQSVGMSRRAIRRMVAWECVRFGARGLVAGLVLSFVVTLLLYNAMSVSFGGLGYAMPWGSVAIAFAVSALVTVAACAYGLKHANTDNVVEALRMQ